MMNYEQNTKDRFHLGFEILRQQYESQRQIAENGVDGIISLVGALIAWGTTHFEAIFQEVADIVGDDHLEQTVSDVLCEYEGTLWEPLLNGHYRLRK